MSTHQARKRFGQNFLHDPTVIERILRLLNIQADQSVVEIGPGQGALTIPLLKQGVTLDVVELDRDLIQLLQRDVAPLGQLTIHSADALKFDFQQLVKPDKTLNVIGNLPYNISTPLLFHLLEFAPVISCMTFMLQKEVVDRLAAQPDSSDYGRLSVMMQYHCQVEKQFDVGAGAFKPAPKVDSSIVQLFPHKTPPVNVQTPAHLQQVVTASFAQRRKTLRNNLKGLLTAEQITAIGIDPQARAETLSLAEFAQLANQLSDKMP